MRISCAFLVLGVCASVATAAEGPWAYRDPDAALAIWASPRLLPLARTSPPTDLWADPAAAAWAAHVRAQLELLEAMSSDVPPLLAMATDPGEHLVQCWLRSDPDDGLDVPWLWIADGRSVAGRIADWCADALARLPAQEVGGFLGKGDGASWFVGQRAALFACGHSRLLDAIARRPPFREAQPAAPLALRWDGAELVRRLDQLGEVDPSAVTVLDAFGAWRSWGPRLSVAVGPAADGWASEVLLDGLGVLPFGQIDPELLALARTGSQIDVAASLPPTIVWQLAVALGGDSVAAWGARAAGGADPATITGLFTELCTGDLLLQGAWRDGPLPRVALALRLHDGAEAAPLLNAALAALDAIAEQRDDAAQAWTLPTPVGGLVIARAGDLLVCGNDEELIATWLAGIPGDAGLAAGAALLARVDVPAIAAQWLPMAYAMANAYSEPLGEDPLAIFNVVAWQLRAATLRPVPPPSISVALMGDTDHFARQLRRALGALFPGADARECLDRSFAFYVEQPAADAKPDRLGPAVSLVMRLDDGYAVVGRWHGETSTGLDAEALAAKLQGRKHLLGPEPAVLVPLAMPKRPVIDRRWLPPIAPTVRHLRPWTLRIDAGDFRLSLAERGLPVAAAALAFASVALVEYTDGIEYLRQLALGRQAARAMRTRHAARIAALGRLAAAARTIAPPGPTKASDLLGAVAAADLAALNGGRAPTPDELDALLPWSAVPSGFPGAFTRLEIEPSWLLYLAADGTLRLFHESTGTDVPTDE